jgi:integrase
MEAAGNGTATRISRLEELHQAARVMGPGRDWSWLRRLAGRVRARHRPARDKRPRLVGADELFGLGLDLMARAAGTPRQQAVQYRDGLAIALLAARPLRRANLAGLRLGASLVRQRGGWWILLPGAETKTGEPIEMPWPEALLPMLETWTAVHRPVLEAHRGRWHRPAEGALWLSADGSPMTGMALYDRITAATKEAFGAPVNPHLFRDCAATTIAVETPEEVGVASGVLGHRGRATTERYYNQARAVDAARRLQATVQGLRDGTVRLPGEDEEESVD